MKPLPTEFVKNDVGYRILERSDTRYFAELYMNEPDGGIIGYETGRITVRTDHFIFEKKIESSEAIIKNEEFGRDKFEKCMTVKFKDEVLSNYIDGNIFDTRQAKKAPYRQVTHLGKG